MDPDTLAVDIVALWHNQAFQWLVALWLISCAVQALPAPDEHSGKIYLWFYTFTQLALANLLQFREGVFALMAKKRK